MQFQFNTNNELLFKDTSVINIHEHFKKQLHTYRV